MKNVIAPPKNNFFFLNKNSSFVWCNLWAAVPSVTQQFKNTNNINKYILLQLVPLRLSYSVTHRYFICQNIKKVFSND